MYLLEIAIWSNRYVRVNEEGALPRQFRPREGRGEAERGSQQIDQLGAGDASSGKRSASGPVASHASPTTSISPPGPNSTAEPAGIARPQRTPGWLRSCRSRRSLPISKFGSMTPPGSQPSPTIVAPAEHAPSCVAASLGHTGDGDDEAAILDLRTQRIENGRTAAIITTQAVEQVVRDTAAEVDGIGLRYTVGVLAAAGIALAVDGDDVAGALEVFVKVDGEVAPVVVGTRRGGHEDPPRRLPYLA